FLAGFIYFVVKKKFSKGMIKPMIILFLLGGLQGFIGWFMVKSGLVPEKYFVGHVELATHFIAALALLSYTLWFALKFLISPGQKSVNAPVQKLLFSILGVLFLQLVYGAFMAGLRAAVIAPTWPDINGKTIPSSMGELTPLTRNMVYNPITIHFIHRGLAYLLFCLVFIWWWKAKYTPGNRLFQRFRFF